MKMHLAKFYFFCSSASYLVFVFTSPRIMFHFTPPIRAIAVKFDDSLYRVDVRQNGASGHPGQGTHLRKIQILKYIDRVYLSDAIMTA